MIIMTLRITVIRLKAIRKAQKKATKEPCAAAHGGTLIITLEAPTARATYPAVLMTTPDSDARFRSLTKNEERDGT